MRHDGYNDRLESDVLHYQNLKYEILKKEQAAL